MKVESKDLFELTPPFFGDKERRALPFGDCLLFLGTGSLIERRWVLPGWKMAMISGEFEISGSVAERK